MKKLKKLLSINKYFKVKDNQLIFTGKSLVANVPKNYAEMDYLIVNDVTNVLGILELVIDDTYVAILRITTMINTAPSEVINNSSDKDYIKLIYKQKDVFLTDIKIIKDANILFSIFIRFISLGKLPKFFTYDSLHTLFDQITPINGVNFNINKTIFELMYSYLCRDSNDLTKEYRLTDMKTTDYTFIGLSNITYAPKSTTSKLLGNYLDAGFTGAILADNPVTDDIEQMLIT